MSTEIPQKLSDDPAAVPKDLQQYREWVEREFKYDVVAGEVEYGAVSARLLTAFVGSQFWQDLGTQIPSIHERFKLRTGYELFYKLEVPSVVPKPFPSFLEKTYRKNFIKRTGVVGERFAPDRWYEGIDDIVRTRFVVRYLDGVEQFLIELRQLAKHHGREYQVEYKCSEYGYYAAHFYVMETIDVVLLTGKIQTLRMWIELQISTQLQEVLLTSLHKLYEKSRMAVSRSDVPWQWRYKDDEFFTNYLGHMLRNIEGMIMEVRRREAIHAEQQ